MRFAVLVVVAVAAASAYTPYVVDDTWPRGLPATASRFTAVGIDGGEVFVGQRGLGFPQPIMVFSKAGDLLRSWGNDTIGASTTQRNEHGVSVQAAPTGPGTVWVTDTGEHTVKRYTTHGKLMDKIGTPGTAGSKLHPLQFGNVADVAFSKDGTAFVSDGDGGVNNRVVALDPKADYKTILWSVGGAGSGPSQFSSPHSIALHDRSGLLIVADRGNNRTQFFNMHGSYMGEWTCTRPGTPWGHRVWNAEELLFQTDGDSQTLTVFSTSAFSSTSAGACKVEQTIDISGTRCHVPHEMAVDQVTGDVYVACVDEPNSGLLRFTQKK